MEKQDYDHHRRTDPLYHMVLFGIIVLTLIGSCVNLYHSVGDEHRLYNASLLVAAMAAVLSASDSRSCRPKAATAMNSRVGRLGGHSHDLFFKTRLYVAAMAAVLILFFKPVCMRSRPRTGPFAWKRIFVTTYSLESCWTRG